MRAVLPTATIVLLLAATAFLLYQTWSLAALAGEQEILAREATAEAQRLAGDAQRLAGAQRDVTGDLQSELAREAAARQASTAEIARLEGQLAATAAQLAAMADTVTQTRDAAAERALAAREAENRALLAMPEGVRLCLVALHAGLHAEGYGTVRFLRAQSLDDDGLHDVEVVHTHEDGLSADLIVAGTMHAALDRKQRRLVFTFLDGSRTQFGQRVPLPEGGWDVVFQPVDGRLLEQRLPYLLKCKGVYQSDAVEERIALPTDVDLTTRMAWLERFDRLLEKAGTPEQIQVQRFRGVHEGAFLEVQLLATDAIGRVEFGAMCAQFAVEIDRTANVVSLVLRDGMLRRGEAISNITAVGYRILLPDLKPATAVEIMLGMVVYK